MFGDLFVRPMQHLCHFHAIFDCEHTRKVSTCVLDLVPQVSPEALLLRWVLGHICRQLHEWFTLVGLVFSVPAIQRLDTIWARAAQTVLAAAMGLYGLILLYEHVL